MTARNGPSFGLGRRVGHLVAGGLGVGQDLVQGLVADPVVPQIERLEAPSTRTFRRISV